MIAAALVLATCASISLAAPRTIEDARRTETLFTVGMAALESGQLDAAIRTFRAILARHPDLVRVRLELARTYFFNQQWGEARREFELVLSTDLPPGVRENVLLFIRRIDARRGFEWDLSLAVSQIGDNRNFEADQIPLRFGETVLPFDVERSSESEIGVVFDISARASFDIDSDPGAAAPLVAFVRPFAFGDYTQSEALRDVTYGMELGTQYAFAQTTVAFSLQGSRRDVAARRYESRFGPRISFQSRSGAGQSVFGSLNWQTIDNHRADGFDGHLVSGDIGVGRAFGGSNSLSVSLFASRRRMENAFDEYDRYGLSVSGSTEPGFGLRLSGSAYVARRNFLSTNPIFVGDPDEVEYGGSIRVEKADLFIAQRFTPYAEVSASRVDSDIAAFGYTEQEFLVGLEKVF